MAEEEVSKDDVILKQMEGVAFGGSTADALNLFLSGLQTFGNNFAVICDTIIQFFHATKLRLQKAKKPFTKILVQSVRLSHCIQVLPIFPFNPFFVFLNIINFFFFPVKLQKNNTFKITKKCTFF